MVQIKWALLLAVPIALGGLTVACGGDDIADAPKSDSGPPGSDGGPDGGGCTFATYVIGLVTTSTNPTAQPDPTLGAGCKDSTDQAEFKPLFP